MTLHEFDYEKESVVSIVKKILTDAINMKASDIHFDPTANSLIIKFRINGNLQEYTIVPETIKTNITTRVKILSNMNITDNLRPQTGTINFEAESRHHDMRVSSLPICDGEKIVIHISNYENNIKSISKMGFYPEDSDKIKKLIKNNQGLILITGSALSGKTTTMYAMLKEINSKSISIISIEDPVKMKLEGINQVEISPDKGITYKNALKYSVLQDPNVICIDNLIDDEIARDAIRASITGKLVLSSLYTKNAYTTIDTLLNMDIENYLLGSNLSGIISQRLVKQLCPKCKEKRKVTEYEKIIIKTILNKDIDEIYFPKGCDECHNGYINQIPIVEVIELNDELRSAITNKKDRKTIRNLLYKDSNALIVNGFNKVIDGETSFDEMIRIIDVNSDFTQEDKDFKDFILGNNLPPAESTSIEKNNQETEEQSIETPLIEETQVSEEQSIVVPEETQVVEKTITNNDTQTEEPTNNEVQSTETTNEETVEEVVETETKNKAETSPIEEKIIDEDKLIAEINELVSSDIEEYNVLDDITIEEEEKEEEETIVNNTTSENVEESTSKKDTEVSIPTPIDANIVEEKTTEVSNDDDDEDDFGYGEGYENTF